MSRGSTPQTTTTRLRGVGTYSWVWQHGGRNENQQTSPAAAAAATAAATTATYAVKRYDVTLAGLQGSGFARLDPRIAARRIQNEYTILQRLAAAKCDGECDLIVKPIELKVRKLTGMPYAIVMEAIEPVDTQTMTSWLADDRGSQLVTVLRQVTTAIARTHGLGIVHRDIKPSNLLFGRRGDDSKSVRVVLIDWGHALDTRQGPLTLLRRATATGTLSYRSPETLSAAAAAAAAAAATAAATTTQWAQGKSFDALVAQDIWSLGCLFLDLIFVGGHEHAREIHQRFACKTPTDMLSWWRNHCFPRGHSSVRVATHKTEPAAAASADSLESKATGVVEQVCEVVAKHMLVWDASKRSSAQAILDVLHQIESRIVQSASGGATIASTGSGQRGAIAAATMTDASAVDDCGLTKVQVPSATAHGV